MLCSKDLFIYLNRCEAWGICLITVFSLVFAFIASPFLVYKFCLFNYLLYKILEQLISLLVNLNGLSQLKCCFLIIFMNACQLHSFRYKHLILVFEQRWRQNGAVSGEEDSRVGDGTTAPPTEYWHSWDHSSRASLGCCCH